MPGTSSAIRCTQRRPQKPLNPPPPARLEKFGSTFVAGDKAMQIANGYECELCNGDIGRLTRINEDALQADLFGHPPGGAAGRSRSQRLRNGEDDVKQRGLADPGPPVITATLDRNGRAIAWPTAARRYGARPTGMVFVALIVGQGGRRGRA
jgi:hypothetical protein